jgi:ketosteroid isomerase-like protein
MTAAEDIERIRSGYAAWNTGDLGGVVEFMSEDVEIRPVLGDVVAADVFRGHEGVRRWFETIHATLEDFRAEIEDVREVGEGRYLVLLHFTGRGAASGADVTLDGAHIVRLQDGILTAIDGYQDRAEALAAVGLA